MSKIDPRQNFAAKTKELLDCFNLSNLHQLPKLVKVTINVGLGQHRLNKETVSFIETALQKITGQKPVATVAKKSIAGFKLRQGEIVGLKVTLRSDKMNDFLERLLNIYLPRLREFRGFTLKNFDKQGNLSIGLKDATIFSELGHNVLDHPFSLGITVTISNSTPERSFELLSLLGFPMRKPLGTPECSG